MPDAVLVDGYNVLHAIPRFAPRGGDVAEAREAFERWLSQAAARHRVGECVLVWDGRRGGRASSQRGRMRVLYTEFPRTADERLLELCRGPYVERAGSTWVVSSDRDVQVPARQLGFTALGAMTFYGRWSAGDRIRANRRRPGGDRGEEGRPSGGEADPRPTRAEVDLLLEQLLARRKGSEGGTC